MFNSSVRRPRTAAGLPVRLAGAAAGGMVLVGLLGAPAHAQPLATAAPSAAPLGAVAGTAGSATFVPGPCPRTPEPIPALKDARCGTLTVPENRAKHSRRTITLGVAIVPALSPTPAPDPIVWFAGGPGDDAVGEAQLAIDGGLNRDRDVIFMSQRGTYSADPELTCPVIDRFYARAVGLLYDAPSTGRLHVAATRACRNQLTDRGVDLSVYNGTESAADYADLRVALGIPQWNVYGISYGTDLALIYMREHPEGIRSVGIDGIVPPSLAGPAMTWSSAKQGFDSLFSTCAQQPACAQRYPDLANTFTDLVSKLEADPVTTYVNVPSRDKPVKVVIDGGTLVNWLTSATHVAPGVPRSIDELAHGNPQRIAEQWAGGKVSPQAIGRISHGLAYGVFCSEWVPYENPSEVIRAGKRAFPSFPRSVLAQAPQLPFLADDCHAWDVPKAPSSVRDITRSDIPTLAMSAGFDSQTGASNGAYVARTLPNATTVTIPYVAHVAFAASPCAQSIVGSFFDNPGAPDTSCIAGLEPPEFEIGPPPAP
ncbi:pimeloyl-ACP methyl ester carboxylesterase [Kitasatospora sp. MAP12-15]|uniref:alpha/beta hydrolase n=1 Tax=unclassified Kitasatospora TaxID=2633591 RepID=UPI0024749ED4|nr:alpha/beta hydrolase [Kitasatospora sp. MAP12-44]MDH6108310.1 pimeloyl-ACP methyl ester carboxylesterase [Kitasatospora sp. MAP12-44]